MTQQKSEEIEADNRQFLKRKILFDQLVASEPWKELVGILTAQHATQLQSILEPPDVKMDGTMRTLMSEYQKGVVFGIQLTLRTPYATIETAKEIISDLNRQAKKDEDHGRTSVELDPDGNDLPDGAIVRDLSGSDE